jgi:hypothetical protein
MSKTTLLKKRKPTKPGDPPPPTKIKETLVGDPSISFTVDMELEYSHEHGCYARDFVADIYLYNPVKDDDFEPAATVTIKKLSTASPYIFIPFGDANYSAGQKFLFRLILSAKYPDGSVLFDGAQFEQKLIGGGIVEHPNGSSKKTNGKPKSRKK